MGKLIYHSEISMDFEDRVLAHLQIVIGTKLRRGESFIFSWRVDGAGNTLWLAPGIPLHFKYDGSRLPPINHAWIKALTASANSAGGLHLIPEPPTSAEPAAEKFE